MRFPKVPRRHGFGLFVQPGVLQSKRAKTACVCVEETLHRCGTQICSTGRTVGNWQPALQFDAGEDGEVVAGPDTLSWFVETYAGFEGDTSQAMVWASYEDVVESPVGLA